MNTRVTTRFFNFCRRLRGRVRGVTLSRVAYPAVIKKYSFIPTRSIVFEWFEEWHKTPLKDLRGSELEFISVRAAQWGADQELDACCRQISECSLLEPEQRGAVADYLRWCRREYSASKSLRCLAQEALDRFFAKGHDDCTDEEVEDDYNTICFALDQLED
jgi:hypothetical protein